MCLYAARCGGSRCWLPQAACSRRATPRSAGRLICKETTGRTLSSPTRTVVARRWYGGGRRRTTTRQCPIDDRPTGGCTPTGRLRTVGLRQSTVIINRETPWRGSGAGPPNAAGYANGRAAWIRRSIDAGCGTGMACSIQDVSLVTVPFDAHSTRPGAAHRFAKPSPATACARRSERPVL